MGAGMEAGSGNADGTAHQLGLMVELPIHKLIACDEPQAEPSAGRTEIEVTPAFAYVLDNLGRDIRYIDAAQSDELPRMSRTGLSVLVAAVSGDKEYCSIRGSLEWEKPLIGDSPVLARAGVEIGILGAFFARRGLLEFNEVDSRLSTYGLGFRLRGLLNELLQGNRADDSCSLGAYLARHFDLAVDYAKYGSQDGNAFSKTWFYAISVSL